VYAYGVPTPIPVIRTSVSEDEVGSSFTVALDKGRAVKRFAAFLPKFRQLSVGKSIVLTRLPPRDDEVAVIGLSKDSQKPFSIELLLEESPRSSPGRQSVEIQPDIWIERMSDGVGAGIFKDSDLRNRSAECEAAGDDGSDRTPGASVRGFGDNDGRMCGVLSSWCRFVD